MLPTDLERIVIDYIWDMSVLDIFSEKSLDKFYENYELNLSDFDLDDLDEEELKTIKKFKNLCGVDDVKYLSSQRSIKFTYKFNQPVVLPDGLHTVHFNNDFKQSVVLPDSLHTVHFGWNFNQPVDLSVNQNLHTIKFYHNFNHSIDFSACQNLHTVDFGSDFNQLVLLPQTLHTVKFGWGFKQQVRLPETLHTLYWTCYHYIRLPAKLNTVVFGWNYNHPSDFSDNRELRYVIFGSCFNQSVVLPAELHTVRFGKNFHTLVELPENISEVSHSQYLLRDGNRLIPI